MIKPTIMITVLLLAAFLAGLWWDEADGAGWSQFCKNQTRTWGDESYMQWNDEENCWLLIEIKSGASCQDALKEAEEELRACQSQFDAIITLPEGWRPIGKAEGVWSDEEASD